jgi:hypothetical protein
MGPSRSRREARSRQITWLTRWNAKDRIDLQRPLLRSDRLLGLPAADRQNLGCSPAIEGTSPRCPPKYARFSGRMSGRRRETHLATKLGELVADGARTRGKCAKTMHMVHAAEACSLCARGVGPDGSRQLPAESGCRQREKGRCHEAGLAWGVAGRISEPGHTRGPSRNRPSRTAGPAFREGRHGTIIV